MSQNWTFSFNKGVSLGVAAYIVNNSFSEYSLLCKYLHILFWFIFS